MNVTMPKNVQHINYDEMTFLLDVRSVTIVLGVL